MHYFYLVSFLFFLLSCSYDSLFFGEDDQPEKSEEMTAKPSSKSEEALAVGSNRVRPLTRRELELKVAQLTSRIEQLEIQMNRQSENFTILQKGMTTGLIPNEWTEDEPYYNAQVEGESRSKKSMENLSAFPLDSGPKSPLDTLLNQERGSKGSSGLTNRQRKDYERKHFPF